jgi:predicted AAA+ superfamily ATPase
MDKIALNNSINEWHEVFKQTRDALVKRGAPSLPKKGLAAAILGVRRGGKTFQAIEMSLEIPEDATLYYNFEDPIFYNEPDVANLDLLLATAIEFRRSKIELLIFDEIHNVDGWERWLRKLIDSKQYHIIVTGSSAKLLSRELSTALSGRALKYEVWPLSFLEFLAFTGRELSSLNESRKHLREYITWGGFPEAVLTPDDNAKRKLLRQYLDDIVLKDVISRNEIRSKRTLDRLVMFYLTNISSCHSINSIRNAFEISADMVNGYTAALTDTYAVLEVERFDPNLKRQARAINKIYSIDTGLRKVGSRSISDDLGKLLENLVYLELRRRSQEVFYFSETKEVDFIITESYKPKRAIQVCADLSLPQTRARELEALDECMSSLGVSQGTVVTFDQTENFASASGRKIKIVPFFKWVQESV